MAHALKVRKKILMISFYFAPEPAVGAKRFSFLSKMLQEKFTEIHVLTVKEKYITALRDDTVPHGGKIHRVAMYPPFPLKNGSFVARVFNRLWGSGYLCLTDPYSGWILPGLIRGLKIIRRNEIDTVIATGPPFSTMVIGLLLKLMSNISLILDYRDPWTNIKRKYYENIFARKINLFFEKLTISHASAIVFCTQQMKDNFMNCLGKHTQASTYVVTNGFHDVKDCLPLPLDKGKTNMVYAGAFYGERSIGLLAEPLSVLLKEGVITPNNFCFHIFGTLKNHDREVIKDYGLHEIIKEHALVPHNQLIRYLKSADILLLLVSNRMSYSFSYKFFDYLSVKKPVFGIVPENSAMEQIIKETGCGQCAYINNADSIFENLSRMLVETNTYSYSNIDRYKWAELSNKYSEIIKTN